MKVFLKINNRVICAKASRHFWRLAQRDLRRRRRGDVHLTANTQTTPPCGTSAFQPTSELISSCWNAGSTP